MPHCSEDYLPHVRLLPGRLLSQAAAGCLSPLRHDVRHVLPQAAARRAVFGQILRARLLSRETVPTVPKGLRTVVHLRPTEVC